MSQQVLVEEKVLVFLFLPSSGGWEPSMCVSASRGPRGKEGRGGAWATEAHKWGAGWRLRRHLGSEECHLIRSRGACVLSVWVC